MFHTQLTINKQRNPPQWRRTTRLIQTNNGQEKEDAIERGEGRFMRTCRGDRLHTNDNNNSSTCSFRWSRSASEERRGFRAVVHSVSVRGSQGVLGRSERGLRRVAGRDSKTPKFWRACWRVRALWKTREAIEDRNYKQWGSRQAKQTVSCVANAAVCLTVAFSLQDLSSSNLVIATKSFRVAQSQWRREIQLERLVCIVSCCWILYWSLIRLLRLKESEGWQCRDWSWRRERQAL